jgi:hypothetical protein
VAPLLPGLGIPDTSSTDQQSIPRAPGPVFFDERRRVRLKSGIRAVDPCAADPPGLRAAPIRRRAAGAARRQEAPVEHVVFFPAPDGSPTFHRVTGLEDAVRLVEHLRNVEGVDHVSVHPLGAEVPLAFRAYYRVEVPAADVAPAPVPEQVLPEQSVPEQAPAAETGWHEAPVAAEEPAVEVAPEAPALEPVVADEPVAVGANGHGGEPVKSLGFFAT